MASTTQAPRISGLTFQKKLGAGGFSNVYLYEQKLPKRLVAVKVLNSPVHTKSVREQFIAEANVMAQLSNHPSMVTIHAADIAEDRRPYLVMEYCSKPSMAQQVRSEGFTVAEVLRIGIRIASAVEVAHQHHILHRDIKPANILTTDYGWPALTDFGLSSVGGQRAAADISGLSIPWAPPEVLDNDDRASVQSDIYSLAATLYTMLAGHHPFHSGSSEDTVLELIQRIETQPVPEFHRSDVPVELFELLKNAMDKRPSARPQSAASFARMMQRIETSLQLYQTPLDLPPVEVERSDTPHVEPTRQRALLTDQASDIGDEIGESKPRERKSKRAYFAAAIVGVLAAIVAVSTLYGGNRDDGEVTSPSSPGRIEQSHVPPNVTEIVYDYDDSGNVVFSWDEVQDDEVSTYAWRSDATGTLQRTHKTSVTVALEGDAVCIDVAAVSKTGGLSNEWKRACAPKPG